MNQLGVVLAAAGILAASTSVVAAPNVVKCRFEEKGRSCRAWLTPCEFPQQPVGNMSCDSGLRIVCNGKVIHDGTFTSGWTISPLASMCPDCVPMDIHDKGATIVIPQRPRPAYPILKYDATDHISEFENADARLYFESHGVPLRGTCSIDSETRSPVSLHSSTILKFLLPIMPPKKISG